MVKQRMRLYASEAVALGLNLKQDQAGRKQARYQLTPEQAEEIRIMRLSTKGRSFVEVIQKKGKNGEIVSTVEKLQSEPVEVPDNFEIVKISTSETTGQQWIQYMPKENVISEESIDFDSIIQKHIKPIEFKPVVIDAGFFAFDRCVYTDLHIAMNPNANGHSLYGGKWDREEIEETRTALVNHILQNKKSNTLIIDELGDFMDGWNGETVRGGHALPQNMDNEEAFDIGLGFKVKMIDELSGHYENIICHNICNDNHAGAFGYVVNSAFKSIIEIKYSNVEVINYRGFIEHYTHGKNCFILTHGKDGKSLKFGFKPILDHKQETKISNYIDEHFLYTKDSIIEFSKGDSHQDLFDNSTSDKFNYYNYPALSPSSEWVQTNFKKGVRGFYLFNYREDGTKVHVPLYFEWKR